MTTSSPSGSPFCRNAFKLYGTPIIQRDFARLGAWAFPPAAREPWAHARDLRKAFYGRWTRYEARLKGSKNSAYGERTWYVDGVALSARLPKKIVMAGGGP